MMKRRVKAQKKKMLFAGIMSALLLVFWSGLAVLVFISTGPETSTRFVRNSAPSSAIPDPASNPEEFSLYAERTSYGHLTDYPVSVSGFGSGLDGQILTSELTLSNFDSAESSSSPAKTRRPR
jgi:hypothetical protein